MVVSWYTLMEYLFFDLHRQQRRQCRRCRQTTYFCHVFCLLLHVPLRFIHSYFMVKLFEFSTNAYNSASAYQSMYDIFRRRFRQLSNMVVCSFFSSSSRIVVEIMMLLLLRLLEIAEKWVLVCCVYC